MSSEGRSLAGIHADGVHAVIETFVEKIDQQELEIERLRAALKEIAENPCIDSEGNSQIARAALDNQQLRKEP